MSVKLLQTSTLAAVVGLASINTHAASIWLTPAIQDTNVGGVASLDLWADASDVGGFLAGGLDLFYDPTIVSYNGDFAFDAAFPTDPDFSRPGTSGNPDDCATDPSVAGCSGPGEINGIAFGSFSGLAGSGPTLVGSLSFTGLNLGTTLLTMADNDTPAGIWFSAAGDDLAGLVSYVAPGAGPTDVNVVPVPAAVWLFGTGLLGLVGVARRRK